MNEIVCCVRCDRVFNTLYKIFGEMTLCEKCYYEVKTPILRFFSLSQNCTKSAIVVISANMKDVKITNNMKKFKIRMSKSRRYFE